MKKQEWVDNLMASEVEQSEKIRRLNSACDYYITAGKCNGCKSGNCNSCPITTAKRTIVGEVRDEADTRKYAPKRPDVTIMFKSKNFTFNWVANTKGGDL